MSTCVKCFLPKIKVILMAALAALVVGCAHPINITQLDDQADYAGDKVSKTVAYVITDAQKQEEVISAGGGGDKVSYYPYRDLEKTIRSVLGSVYDDVYAINSTTDFKAIESNNIQLIYVPVISTSSSSESMFTWPPTKFTVNLSCSVNDEKGQNVANVTVSGEGAAEFSEFKNDFGLSARRASTDLGNKFASAIRKQEAIK
ncbi:hypothetical protein [Amphritea japonica]|uniref:Lipoprotein n=1 Tax=Amphritea japonica ATCC BAA-1530 TaxID=1278309 RepID=A0A7R6P2V4_9GAMM|nr:hypothetical protein [Amphritea japonica]BBB25984.1 conserved hypothetical protein [Amphritea japonica ATCC BAA-1530]